MIEESISLKLIKMVTVTVRDRVRAEMRAYLTLNLKPSLKRRSHYDCDATVM